MVPAENMYTGKAIVPYFSAYRPLPIIAPRYLLDGGCHFVVNDEPTKRLEAEGR